MARLVEVDADSVIERIVEMYEGRRGEVIGRRELIGKEEIDRESWLGWGICVYFFCVFVLFY